MKFLIYSDVHFSEYSSIVRSHGNKYSKRLENLIDSVNWAENAAIENNCDEVICLGDFFDKPDLNSREITALNEIEWNDLPHTFLVGNHDASTRNLLYNSVNSLLKYGFNIVNSVTLRHLGNCDLLLIPYLLDEDKKTIKEYFDDCYANSLFVNKSIRKVVLSHNDVKGLQYGKFESKSGFDISDIENNCNLFLNGHLHNVNGKPFANHAFNIGNLSGQNFNEDALIFSHRIFILDTEEGTLISIENPYAFNFYQLECLSESDLTNIDNILENLKDNSVLSVKCDITYKDIILKKLSRVDIAKKIIENRIIYTQKQVENKIEDQSIAELANSSDDYLDKFILFCREHLSDTALLEEELAEVCKK